MTDKLENERREYRYGKLDRGTLADSPLDQFTRWMDEAIAAGITDPTAMTVTTVDRESKPASRIVLLKGFNEEGFRFYTNLQSHKAVEIASNPAVALHFPWLQMDRQVIVRGSASRLPAASAEAYFATRPRESQIAAWVSSQSRPIESRAALDDAYTEVTKRFDGATVPMPDHWGGFNVKPDHYEFWQGGEHRLHDRFVYALSGADWQIQRLAP